MQRFIGMQILERIGRDLGTLDSDSDSCSDSEYKLDPLPSDLERVIAVYGPPWTGFNLSNFIAVDDEFFAAFKCTGSALAHADQTHRASASLLKLYKAS
ncbi:hypothetical protein HDU88_001167 [Geranomyces variabilis]|nr:hypothetical protein HDU88_001167 [Geranomyces variabilis]